MGRITLLLFITIGIAVEHGRPTEAKPSKCNCNCTGKKADYICAKDPISKDVETFQNQCYFSCFICTSGKSYVIINKGHCAKGN